VDIDIRYITDINRFSYQTIANYDIIHGNILIFGIKPEFIEFDSDKIPLNEATRQMLNRAGGLMLAHYLNNCININDNAKAFTSTQIIKCIFSIVDYHLLLNHKYHWSYEERSKIINNSKIITDTNLLELYNFLISQKLQPTHKYYFSRNQKLFMEAIRLFNKYFLYFESIRLKKRIYTVQDWLKLYIDEEIGSSNLQNYLKSAISNIIKFGLPTKLLDRSYLINSSSRRRALGPYILSYIETGEPSLLYDSCKKINKNVDSLCEFIEQYSKIWHRFPYWAYAPKPGNS